MFEQLGLAIVDMKEDRALETAAGLLEGGSDPLALLDACRLALEEVGSRFETGTYFLSELIMAGEILAKISDLAKPYLSTEQDRESLGRVLIGTVAGDIHDLGKNMVGFLLEISGFEVRDIGVDVPPERFVSEIMDFKPRVVGVSGLLTVVYDSLKKTVEAIEEAGLRDEVRIMIGGAAMSDKIRDFCGADAFGPDAASAVSLARQWTGEAA